MKVLHVINCLKRSGGAEKFLLDLVIAMKRQGVDVEVLSIIAPPEDNREFVDIVQAAGIPVHILANKGLYSFRHIARLRCFFHRHRYDVVHAHLFPAQYFCALVKQKSSLLFFTEHSTDNRRRHNWLFRKIDSLIYRCYDKIVCISSKTEETLLKQVGKIPTVIIPNGINISIFEHADPVKLHELSNVGDDVKVITMCAAFRKEKDYMTLFRAVNYLPANVHVLCVGDGEYREEYEAYCKTHDLSSRVHFLGLRKDVARIFKASDVIVLSTYYEGFSIAMLEAMATGRPFVASAVLGIQDLVEGAAVLFPLGDEKKLAESICRLLNNPNYYAEMVSKGLSFAKQYDISLTAAYYVDLYRNT